MDTSDTLIVIFFCLACFGIYWAPTIIALNRHHRQTGAIAALNLLGGWTVIGWIAAMVWSLTN
jgi:hypothetical protein